MAWAWFFAGFLLALAGPAVLTAATVTLGPVSDAYVNDSNPAGTHDNAWLAVGRSPTEFKAHYRSFLRFNLSGVPANAAVSSAVLRLNLQAFEGSSAAAIELRRVLAGWSGGTLTWNNQPATSGVVASTTVGAAVGQDYTWSIGALVQSWIQGQVPNYGLELQIAGEPTATATRTFGSSNQSNTAVRPELVITYTLPPDITVSPSSLHFATRAVNTLSPPQNLTLRNDGAVPLTVQSIEADSSEFPLSGLPGLPLILNPGSNRLFQVRFLPVSAGTKIGYVRIQSDDPATPILTIPCDGVAATGPGSQPPLATEFAAYEFTPVPTGMVSVAQEVFVVNRTTQARLVTGIGDLPSGSPFRIVNRLAPLPATVPAGGRIKICEVQFAPAQLQSFEAMLQITTDAAALNPVMARLSGRGRHPSVADFYSDPRPFHVEFNQLDYTDGEDFWLRYDGVGPAEVRIYLVSPAQDDVEVVDLVRAGVGPSCRQVQRVTVANDSAGHFDGRLAAKPGDFIFAFVHDPGTGRSTADYAFIRGGTAQGLFSLSLDSALTPQPASVAGRPGETPRGLAAIADERGYPGVFGDDQLILQPRDLTELNDFLKRYDGRIVDDGRRSKSTGQSPRPYYLVRVNLDRADAADFEFMAELAGVRGTLRTSSDATRRLYSILIREQLESRRVTLNPRVEFFSQPATVEGAGLNGGSSDAFGLNYVRDCVQKVNRAWSYVALQDRDRANGVTVRLAIIDDGFCINPDLPMAPDGGWDLVGDDPDPTGPRVTVFGADWHGSSVASAAASLHNNALGSAGAGGQVANLMFYRLGNLGHAFEVGTALDLAVADGAQVVNMSFGLPCRVFGGPTFCEIDRIDYWLGLLFVCPLLNPWMEAAQDLLAGFLPGRVTCEELYLLMAAARSSMLAGVEDALDAGVCLVASSGNGMGPVPDSDIADFDIIPASFDGVIAVGAMDAAYQNTEFFGNRVDVWAMMPVRAYAPPGNAEDCNGAPVIGNFGQTSGGSGFVAGIACLMRAVNPAMTPDDIRAAMRGLPDLAPSARVQRPLDAYRLVRDAGTAAGLPNLQLDSPGLGFDESIPVGFGCPAAAPVWPPNAHASDDTPPTAGLLAEGTVEFTDRALHPFVFPAGMEADLYRFQVPANLPASAAYDVEIATVYPTASGDVLPHPQAFIVNGVDGHSTATYRRSGLFLDADLYFSVQGNDPVLANRDNVYSLTATIARRDIEPDRYDRAPLGDPPNNMFGDATFLPNAAGGDEWETSGDGLMRTWSLRVSDLNFHTPDDIDYFRLDLPDEALNDCYNVNEDCPFDAVRGLSSGRLVLRVIGAEAVIKLDRQGRELERDDNYLEYGCNETDDFIYFAVVGRPDRSLEYQVRITYTLPDEGGAFKMGELCNAWRQPPPPDPSPDGGGFYVVNPGKSDPEEFWLGLPCSPIVCDPPLYDYLLFNWNRTDRFSMEFQYAAGESFVFELLDTHLNVLGRAQRVSDTGFAPAGANGNQVAERLTVSQLPVGFYLVRVTGQRPLSAYTAQFLTLASPALEIMSAGTGAAVTVSWPSSATGYVLDQSSVLGASPSAWSQVSFPYQTNATHISVTLPVSAVSRFYRLRKSE